MKSMLPSLDRAATALQELLRGFTAVAAAAAAETSQGPAISVITATRNKASYLELTLASLERQLLPARSWELVITDDASTDDTARILDEVEQRSRISLVRKRSRRCRGRSGARNDALELARGRFLVFLDDDRIVRSDFLLAHLVRQLEGDAVVLGDIHRQVHSHVGPDIDARMWQLSRALAPGDLRAEGPRRILEPHALDDPETLQSLVVAGRHNYRGMFEFFEREGVPCPFPWVYFTTGNASAPRDKVVSVGGFDEGFRGWGLEDQDLAHRLFEAGLPFNFQPAAPTLHQLHPRSRANERDRNRNLAYFFSKNPQMDRGEMEPILRGKKSATDWHRERKSAAAEPAVCKSTARPRKLLWCTRGHGLGHATRDAVLLQELRALSPDLDVHVLSYGRSATYLAKRGFHVADIGESCETSAHARYDAFARAIDEHRPDLLVSDEELLALPAARSAGVRSIYLTNWLLDESHHSECGYLQFADRILFADTEDAFELPAAFREKTLFCGPWLADGPGTTGDWRQFLGLQDERLIVVTAGHGFPEDEHFLVEAAWAASLLDTPSRVVLLAGALWSRVRDEPLPEGTEVVELLPDTAGLFRSADVVITRGGHTTLWELAAAGVPALAVPRPRHRDRFLTDYALRMARAGSCIYLPEVMATRDSMRAALQQLMTSRLSDEIGRATVDVDFAQRRRDTARVLLTSLEGNA